MLRLRQVPLGVTTRTRVWLLNDGYDNTELSVRLPSDAATRLCLRVTFPEGCLIGLAKERLPVDFEWCPLRPMCFTVRIDFVDEYGRASGLNVTGGADGCALMHSMFLKVRMHVL